MLGNDEWYEKMLEVRGKERWGWDGGLQSYIAYLKNIF